MNKFALSKELEQRAKDELNETPERRKDYIKHLQEWVNKQPHLNARTDEQWLLNFLRCCKFSTEKAKQKIDFLYSIRAFAPEYYTERNPYLPELQDILSRGILLPISSDIASIIIVRWKFADINVTTLENIMKLGFMILDIFLSENNSASIIGFSIILDFQNLNRNYLKRATFTFAKKLLAIVLKGYGLRIKHIYIVNGLQISAAIIALLKPFMPTKVASRMKVCEKNDLAEIFESVPLSIIPKEYGGQGQSIETIIETTKQKIESCSNWFLDDEKYGVDESKRFGGRATSSSLFGIEGSFRKLEID